MTPPGLLLQKENLNRTLDSSKHTWLRQTTRKSLIDNLLSEVKFKGRKRALLQRGKQTIVSC